MIHEPSRLLVSEVGDDDEVIRMRFHRIFDGNDDQSPFLRLHDSTPVGQNQLMRVFLTLGDYLMG